VKAVQGRCSHGLACFAWMCVRPCDRCAWNVMADHSDAGQGRRPYQRSNGSKGGLPDSRASQDVAQMREICWLPGEGSWFHLYTARHASCLRASCTSTPCCGDYTSRRLKWATGSWRGRRASGSGSCTSSDRGVRSRIPAMG
jgi:hypothetical protein